MANTKANAKDKAAAPKKELPGAGKPEKEAGIAVLISFVGMIFLGAPAIGYLYLDDVRKGVIYLIIGYLLPIAAIVAYYMGALTIVGIVLCLPVLLVPLALHLAIIFDVWKMAEKKKPVLPDFKN